MKSQKIIPVLLLVFLTLNSFSQSVTSKTSTKKPNIVFILADDLGIGEVGCYGSDNNKTPVIDQLAKGGMQFKHGYTAPLCGPSRALILTGRYAFRTGAVNQDRTGLMKPSDEIMLPALLKPAGYVTSMIGKWGQLPLGPADFGFDDYIKFKGSGVYWSAEKKKAETYTVNGVDKPLGDAYMPDLMHNHLVNFITANKDKPFYVYYSMSQVHAKLQPTPDSKPDNPDVYADNIAYMDKLVGKLMSLLEKLKLRENTLIVFMGDNGTANEAVPRATIGGKPLSGKKGSMLECGSLVPFIANWPGVIAPNKVNNDLVDATDLLPTFVEVAGAKLPTDRVLDGRSFVPQLKGNKGNPREWIFTELGNKWYVRNANYKLTREGELFDMKNAPFDEKLVTNVSQNKEATEANARLAVALATLNPAGGIMDDGDGSGRHANKAEKKAEKKENKKDKN